jgi:3-oxoadipate enol-lactonase
MTNSAYSLPHDRFGEGPCTVLVHAFPSDRRMWKHVARPLAERRSVLCPDLRGFGHASSLPAPKSLDAHADDLARTLDDLGLNRVALVGLSMGGYVALAFAERHPARLTHLSLVDSRAEPDSADAKAGRSKSMAIVSSLGVSALYDSLEPRLFAPEPVPQAPDTMRGIAVSQSRDGVLCALVAMRDRPDRTAVWQSLEIPTQCIAGRHDAITPPSELEALALAAHSGRFVMIEGAGHLPNVEQPERLVLALDAFLPRA